jgi:hypothetical protein
VGPTYSHKVPRASCYSGTPRPFACSDTGLSPSLVELSRTIHKPLDWPYWRPNPRPKTGLGCSAFARRYLRNRVCFLFLCLLRCFSSAGLLLTPYAFRCRSLKRVVLPHSEIFVSQPGYRLHEAYRRFPRPSSPLNAKTSTVCPY